MKLSTIGKIRHKQHRHKPGVAEQTGFPSPATHYLEPTIDLHQELIKNADATFFVRVASSEYEALRIYSEAVLIIDRSAKAVSGALALVVKDGQFSIMKIPVQRDVNNDAIDTFTLWGVITFIINKAV